MLKTRLTFRDINIRKVLGVYSAVDLANGASAEKAAKLPSRGDPHSPANNLILSQSFEKFREHECAFDAVRASFDRKRMFNIVQFELFGSAQIHTRVETNSSNVAGGRPKSGHCKCSDSEI